MTLAFLACGIVPLLVVGLAAYLNARYGMTQLVEVAKGSLEEKAYDHLISVRDARKHQIEDRFSQHKTDMSALVENMRTQFQDTFNRLGAIQQFKKRQVEKLFDRMIKDATTLANNEDVLDLFSRLQKYHHHMNTGATDGYDISTDEYRQITKEHGALLRYFHEEMDYADVFILCAAHGHVMYTATEGIDLGSNLGHGDYKDQPLAHVWRQVVQTDNPVLTDFEFYAPQNGQESLFVGVPLHDESRELIGVIALQINPDPVNSIVQERAGLGKTGESYVVGRCQELAKPELRSEMVLKEGKIGDVMEDEHVTRAIGGQSGRAVEVGASGAVELVCYDPIEVAGLEWGIISTIEVEEAVSVKLEGEREDLLTKYNNKYGYRDTFLINSDGYCFYTVRREADYQTNFVDGKYKDSNLGALIRGVLKTKTFGFADFRPYEPSNGAPAAFIAQPVLDSDGEVAMIVAIQLSIDLINGIMQSRAGMSETGETYLVGGDKRMRSDSYLDSVRRSVVSSFAGTIAENGVDTKASNEALSGKEGVELITDYRNTPVLSAYAPIDIFGTRWALLAEIDEAEAFDMVKKMDVTSATVSRDSVAWDVGIAAGAFVIILAVGLFAGSRTAGPIVRLAGFAKRIGEGNLEETYETKAGAEVGKLAAAMNRMVARLRTDAWFKAGQMGLAEKIRGEQDMPTLSKNIITHLARHLNAQVGTFYVCGQGDELRLTGTYAHTRRKHLANTIAAGQGIVGQAVLENESILLSDVPDDYVTVESSLGKAVPRNLLVTPMDLNGAVKAVVELGALRPLSDEQIEFLRLVTENVAVAVNSAQDREKMRELLEESQRQTEELQAQSEELQSQQEELKAANEELEEQTQMLKQSEEKLQRQSEKLRAANEELEEKTKYLQQQKNDIEERNEDLEITRMELEEKARELVLTNKYKSEFLANMSHELRTPLNSILILAQSLAGNEEGNLTDKQVESAEVVHSGGKELLNLINDILDLSKVEAGKLDTQIEDVELDAVTSHLQRQFTPVAEQKGLELKIETADGLPQVLKTDGQRVEQILRNLLSNAFKFTRQGSVTLSVHRPDGSVLFRRSDLTAERAIAMSVIDTGIGIPEEKQRAIFEAFQQADGSTSREFGGTGLGLTISREMAQLLGGEIQVVSQEDEGSVFTLYLPLEHTVGPADKSHQEPAASTARDSRRVEMAASGTAEQLPETRDAEFLPDDRRQLGDGAKTVLVIEDDPRFAKILMEFSRQRGYRCLAAGDGRSGLLLASKHKPTAIILDIGLPDIDGLSVLDQLKHNLETRHIPVHIISAQDETADSLQKGAIGHLAKPASAEDIDVVFGKFEAMGKEKVRSVLVVEDDKVQRKTLVKLIANRGVDVTGVGTGKDAYESITSQKFGCVILDLGLPDMTGFELLRDLGELEDLELPPVIVYTGSDLTREQDAELRKYAGDIVIKGVNSRARVLDETMLFLHSVTSTLSAEQKKTIRMLHDPDQVLQGKKVLLVDDDARNTFALAAVLEKAGLEVALADNGRLALEKLDAEPDIELVVMDMMMPVMDGHEAIRAIRVEPRFEKLPIIALTAKAMPEDRGKCLESGANDYMTKPVDVEKLLSLMRVWLFNKEPMTV